MRSFEMRSMSSGAASAVRASSSSASVPITYNYPMKTVAVIGASSNRDKFGNKALRAFANKGYTVFPINPVETEVEGHPAYKSVLDVPGPIDMATFYVPCAIGVQVLDEVVKRSEEHTSELQS